MGKKHDSQYANFGWLHNIFSLLIIYLIILFFETTTIFHVLNYSTDE